MAAWTRRRAWHTVTAHRCLMFLGAIRVGSREGRADPQRPTSTTWDAPKRVTRGVESCERQDARRREPETSASDICESQDVGILSLSAGHWLSWRCRPVTTRPDAAYEVRVPSPSHDVPALLLHGMGHEPWTILWLSTSWDLTKRQTSRVSHLLVLICAFGQDSGGANSSKLLLYAWFQISPDT